MLGLDQDLLVVLIIAAFVFGAKKLPEIGKGLGKGIQEFKKGLSGQEEEPLPKPKETEKDTTDKKE
ncbi:MAG: twin-arginine translocase TatA/TatE family subunit [Thermodesulfobacteriota bacterium]|jgi:sec-independent protein translocase protein TatA